MYIIQFKSCQSFYRIVKTLAVYVIMNDKRISSLWPRVYHSSFSDILVPHSDFTLPYNCDIVHWLIYNLPLQSSPWQQRGCASVWFPLIFPRVCLVPTHSSCFVISVLIVWSTFHVIYPFLSKIFISIPVYTYFQLYYGVSSSCFTFDLSEVRLWNLLRIVLFYWYYM